MILLIDSYDSFSHNLRRLLETVTKHKVVVVQNDFVSKDEYMDCFSTWISKFDYLVVGPGPGHPAVDEDVGIIQWLFSHFKAHPESTIPVLGVCLGFQSLCYAFGNEIKKLPNVRHGQIFSIQASPSDLFGTEFLDFESVRYHSLGVLAEELNDEIITLATCLDESDTIVMAAKHKSLPLYGVQYLH